LTERSTTIDPRTTPLEAWPLDPGQIVGAAPEVVSGVLLREAQQAWRDWSPFAWEMIKLRGLLTAPCAQDGHIHVRPAHSRSLWHYLHILFMRSVPVTGVESIAIAMSYDGIVDFLLLDSHRQGDTQIGALGVTHDWNISRRIVESVRTPVILAGGLGPDNVADAILAVRPAGVDSKTRTDVGDSHTKDLAKVAAFNKAAKTVALT